MCVSRTRRKTARKTRTSDTECDSTGIYQKIILSIQVYVSTQNERMLTIQSQFSVLRHRPDRLTDTKIGEDILCTTEQRVEGHRTVVLFAEMLSATSSSHKLQNGTYVLDKATHTGLGYTTATENLDSVRGRDLCRLCAVGLEERDRTSQLRRLLLIRLYAQTPVSILLTDRESSM